MGLIPDKIEPYAEQIPIVSYTTNPGGEGTLEYPTESTLREGALRQQIIDDGIMVVVEDANRLGQ